MRTQRSIMVLGAGMVGAGLVAGLALTGCGSGGGSAESTPTPAVTVTVSEVATPEAQAPESVEASAGTFVPSTIRENSPCEPSLEGVEITGFRGAPLKCDGSTWVPQY